MYISIHKFTSIAQFSNDRICFTFTFGITRLLSLNCFVHSTTSFAWDECTMLRSQTRHLGKLQEQTQWRNWKGGVVLLCTKEDIICWREMSNGKLAQCAKKWTSDLYHGECWDKEDLLQGIQNIQTYIHTYNHFSFSCVIYSLHIHQ